MEIKIYSIFDNKAEAFMLPFFMHRDAEAMRAIATTAMDEQSSIYHHPLDYTLYRIGVFDNTNGSFVADREEIGTALYIRKMIGNVNAQLEENTDEVSNET